MSYANKFTVELSDVARLIFIDERSVIGNMSTEKVAGVVMTLSNFKAFKEMINGIKLPE